MLDLVIIGAGPSGMYAGYLAYLHKLNVIILEASSELGGQLQLFKEKPVYDMPAIVNVKGKDILGSLHKQIKMSKDKDLVIFNQKVIKIEGKKGNFCIYTKDKQYKTKTIIISTGGGFFKPIKIGIKNETKFLNLKYKVSNINHYNNKNIIIFGGGDSALDWASYLSKFASKTVLVHRRDVFRGQDATLNELKKRVDVMTPFKPISIDGDTHATSVTIQNIKTKEIKKMDCNEILVFFGQIKEINKSNIFDLKSDKNGYLVNQNCETSKEGVFAIGNISSYAGKVKMMITGLGEAATSIGSVIEIVRPEKKLTYYTK